MAYEVINNKRSKSVIRVTGNTDTAITLSQLSADVDETINSVSITNLLASSDGAWKVYRGNDASGVLVLDTTGGGAVDWSFTQRDISISNTATANIFITNSGTGGTLLMTVSKTAEYSPALTGI